MELRNLLCDFFCIAFLPCYLQYLQFGEQLKGIISSFILIKYIWSFKRFSTPEDFFGGLKCGIAQNSQIVMMQQLLPRKAVRIYFGRSLCVKMPVSWSPTRRSGIYAMYNSLRDKVNLLDDTFLIKLQNLFIMRHRVTLKNFFHVAVVKSLHFSLETSCKSLNWRNLELLVSSEIIMVAVGMSYPKMVVSMKLPYNDFYPCHYMVCHLKIVSRNEFWRFKNCIMCLSKWQVAWIEVKYKIFASI